MTTPLEYLSRLNSSVIRLGLAPVTGLLKSLDNPQNAYPSVLIAGTNGKGSIAATIDSILRKAGYRVGLYTSPHLVDLRERILVDGEMIAGEELDALIEEVRGHVEEEVTYFEFLTAVAFLHFCRMRVDVAVLEVGMGGRLDATNVVNPVVSVISNISLEHREYLGNSLADIAQEKGGIVKEGGVCVTAAKQRSVREVIDRICRERKARLYRLGKHIKVRRRGDSVFDYRGIFRNYQGLTCALKGRHQIDNAALALAAGEILSNHGFPIGDNAVYHGLSNTRWEGRLEVLRLFPTVLLDGGHNPAGISALCRTLKEDFTYRRLIFVFGVLGDKDYALMLKRLLSLADAIIITKPKTGRALPPEKLADMARHSLRQVEVVEPAGQALMRALMLSGRDDLICITGSLYLIGEIKEVYAKMKMQNKNKAVIQTLSAAKGRNL
jgi:dihydrofolate synthase / folylpolyglutamate synthase